MTLTSAPCLPGSCLLLVCLVEEKSGPCLPYWRYWTLASSCLPGSCLLASCLPVCLLFSGLSTFRALRPLPSDLPASAFFVSPRAPSPLRDRQVAVEMISQHVL